MTSQPRKQTIAIHSLPNITKSKDNQTMKFTHLIQYNMRTIFLEILYTKCGGETVLRPFSKKSKLSISLNKQSQNYINFVFIVCRVDECRNILKLIRRLLAFTTYKPFLTNKNNFGSSLSTSFSACFLKKNIFLVIFHYLTEFHGLVIFTL